ncbi:MAG: DinB family protein [Abditibacteriaceae bacterium]
MLHFFNHQTHHRGQITAMIETLGYNCGVTDLLWMPGLESGKNWE